MSEATDNVEQFPGFKSFAEKVYVTLSAHNIENYVAQKGKLDYLPWAPAWHMVMTSFPESDFEFDEPRMFEGTGGEQWITVNIREGDNVLTRRWWLPYLDFKNAPVAAPTSLQINNTRMRVLVKCLAMCGLGTELYTGEDVPDKDADAPVTDAPSGGYVLPPADIFEGRGHIDTINSAVPVDAIITDTAGRIKDFDRERIDFEAIDEMLLQFNGKAEQKLWVFENVNTLQNRFLRNYEEKEG